MVALYKQAKRRQVDPLLAGKLIHILNSIVGADASVGFDERLRLLEERFNGTKPNGRARPNGRTRPDLHP